MDGLQASQMVGHSTLFQDNVNSYLAFFDNDAIHRLAGPRVMNRTLERDDIVLRCDALGMAVSWMKAHGFLGDGVEDREAGKIVVVSRLSVWEVRKLLTQTVLNRLIVSEVVECEVERGRGGFVTDKTAVATVSAAAQATLQTSRPTQAQQSGEMSSTDQPSLVGSNWRTYVIQDKVKLMSMLILHPEQSAQQILPPHLAPVV